MTDDRLPPSAAGRGALDPFDGDRREVHPGVAPPAPDDGPGTDLPGEPTGDAVEATADPTPIGEPLLLPPATGDRTSSRSRRRSATLASLVALAVAAAAVVGLVATRDGPPPADAVPLDAWVPYWTLDDALEEAPRRLGSVREVSPFWFDATGVEDITVSPNVDPDAAERFVAAARDAGTSVVPSVVDATGPGAMAAILADPAERTRHVDALVSFVDEGGYDGVDLDYEQFAFADDRSTWAATRPAWVAFVEELSDELRSGGRSLTVSIPPVYEDERSPTSGYWVYDHGAISDHVDRLRIMAYDYSVAEPGPIAPLEFVERSVDGALTAGVDPDKVVLGLAIYGRNWPLGVAGICPDGTVLEDTTSVNARTVDELVERRGATPVFDEVTGEWSFDYELIFADDEASCVQSRRVHYVDGRGARLRMDIARDRRIGAASLWALGFDDDDVWDELLPVVER
ncbi:glycosyl hydrolase family 18 protein [Ilumatobacter sp.]|uniref:glycosyl hydrolase family 18 protein n=1 Tax=Ilumatobacter sp. TaxID=1967498 RepID=UPI003B523981